MQKQKEIYKEGKKDRILQLIIGSTVKDIELGASNYSDVAELHKSITRDKRSSNYFLHTMQFSPTKVEDEKYFDVSESMPIIFEETFIRGNPKPKMKLKDKGETMTMGDKDSNSPKLSIASTTATMDESQEEHRLEVNKQGYVILCHGYQGNHSDMLKVKHYFHEANPYVHFYCSEANEDKTTIDISEMGVNLAREVEEVVHKAYHDQMLGSISFIGHSLGGVIIRAALPHLLKYKQFFKCYMTFSTPHLGVGASDSKLIEAGNLRLMQDTVY